jgi:hypothetical protein
MKLKHLKYIIIFLLNDNIQNLTIQPTYTAKNSTSHIYSIKITTLYFKYKIDKKELTTVLHQLNNFNYDKKLRAKYLSIILRIIDNDLEYINNVINNDISNNIIKDKDIIRNITTKLLKQEQKQEIEHFDNSNINRIIIYIIIIISFLLLLINCF